MVTIEGFETVRVPRRHYVTAYRFYGARQVQHTAEGPRPARADSWRLVCEVKPKSSRGRYILPDFELEPTDAPGETGPRLYVLTSVFEGRERPPTANDELLLPTALGPRVSFAYFLLWNLERLGVIAPGQLDD